MDRGLKQWRQDAGFTQTELANELGLSATTVSMWEDTSKSNTPANYKRSRLAGLLDVWKAKIDRWFKFKEQTNETEKTDRFKVGG